MNLASTDILRIVTSVAVTTIGVHASWADIVTATGVVTPGRKNTAITTATTTTVAASPASGSVRNVKLLSASNNHATTATNVTVQHYDGTTSVDLATVNLLAGERLVVLDYGLIEHYDATGAKYIYSGPRYYGLAPLDTFAETLPRETCSETNTAVAASGTLNMQAIYLKADQLVSTINLHSATTAANTPTHYFFGLYDSALNLVAQTADQTSTAWAANSYRALPVVTPYRVPTSGLYYVGYFMTATTVPTLKGNAAKTGGQLAAASPVLHGTSTTGLTTALPNPAGAITGGTSTFYAAVG